jgi:hypothetical protein
MLIHIVCWKYKEETSTELRAEHIRKLKDLAAVIPEIVTLDVGSDVLHLDRSFDTGLVAVFADREALDIYTDNPEHQKVAALGKRIAEQAVSVDFFQPSPEPHH